MRPSSQNPYEVGNKNHVNRVQCRTGKGGGDRLQETCLPLEYYASSTAKGARFVTTTCMARPALGVCR